MSCHLALPLGATLVEIPALRCRFLAPEGGGRWRCTVYDDRFERAPWCHSAADAIPLGFLARDCPYVVAAGAGKGKIRLREPLLSAIWPRLLAAVLARGLPEYVDQRAFLAEVCRRQGRPYHLRAWPGRPGWLRLRADEPEPE